MTDRVALVTGAARGQGAAIVKRLHTDGFRVAACDVRVDELAASVEGLGDGVVAVSLDVTSEEQWKSAVARDRRAVRVADDIGQQRRCVAQGVARRRDARRVRKQLAIQLPWPVPRHPCHAGHLRARRRRGHRQHMQHRCDAGVPQPRRVRLVEVGAERAHPGRRRRTRAVRYQGERRVSRGRSKHRCSTTATQARLARAPRSDGSASRPRWPTRWRSWCPSRRRSSPAPNSSSTADRSCRSDDASDQITFSGDHRRRAGWAGTRNLPAQGGLSRLHYLRPRGRRRRHLADQHLSGTGL